MTVDREHNLMTAAQRLAFSRSLAGINEIDRERLVAAPIGKIAAARLSVATRCWAAPD